MQQPQQSDESLINEISREIKRQNETDSKRNGADSMTMPNRGVTIYWRPNNYRRQMEIKIVQDSTIRKIKSAILRFYPELVQNDVKHGKIFSIRNIGGCTIQLGKSKIVVIYKQRILNGNKETFCFQGTTREEIDKIYTDMRDKREEIRKKIDSVMFEFCDNFDLWYSKNTDPVWSRHEDWIRGTEMIERLPESCIVYESRWKKVYGKGIEGTKGEPVEDTIRHINNSLVVDLVPEIVQRIEMVEKKLIQQVNPLRWLKMKIRKVSDVVKFKDIVSDLHPDEKTKLENYLLNLEA